MDQSISELPAETAAGLQLGLVLGESLTFTLLAGRCSAAQAETLLRLREEKHYLAAATGWKQFCPRFLKMSATQADRIIKLWQEFGPGIFELRQLIRISTETYRAIEPLIRDGALHFNDEAIELDPVNARKVADAVFEIKRAMSPKAKPEPTIQERLDDLGRRCDHILAEFLDLAAKKCEGQDGDRFASLLNRAAAGLQQIETEQGIH